MSDLSKVKRTEPSVRITDTRFVPTRGSDVQATWRRFGWTPPSENRTPPVFVERLEKHDWEQPMRRVK